MARSRNDRNAPRHGVLHGRRVGRKGPSTGGVLRHHHPHRGNRRGVVSVDVLRVRPHGGRAHKRPGHRRVLGPVRRLAVHDAAAAAGHRPAGRC